MRKTPRAREAGYTKIREAGYPGLREAGYTLVEALVTILLLVIIMLAFLMTLDATSKMTKVQTGIAEITENLRFSVDGLVRMTRMAGTGGLPVMANGAPAALRVWDNTVIPTGGQVWITGGKFFNTVDGTDALTIRGVIIEDLFDTDAIAETGDPDDTEFTYDLTVQNISPYTSGAQTLATVDRDSAVILGMRGSTQLTAPGGNRRFYGDYRIANVTTDAIHVPGNTSLTIALAESTATDALNASGTFNEVGLGTVMTAGVLDQFTFFIMPNATGEPSLFRYDASSDQESEMVSNIQDLQVALGVDMDGDGAVNEATEWFSNLPAANYGGLLEVRISVVARSLDPDLNWENSVIAPENGTQNYDTVSTISGDYRFRTITVRVALRSHPFLE